MKVHELIEKLEQLPVDAKIVVFNSRGEYDVPQPTIVRAVGYKDKILIAAKGDD